MFFNNFDNIMIKIKKYIFKKHINAMNYCCRHEYSININISSIILFYFNIISAFSHPDHVYFFSPVRKMTIISAKSRVT